MSKTIIFDFDGTLGDSFGIMMSILQQMVRRPDTIRPEELQRLRHLPARQLMRELRIPLWRVPGLMRRGRRLFRARIDEVIIFPDMAATIKALHEQGFTLYILSTNSTQNLHTFIHANNIGQYFSAVQGEVGLFSKRRALVRLMRRYNINPATAWYVGDELRDITGAKAAGIRPVAVAWGYQHPEALVAAQPATVVAQPLDLLSFFTNPDNNGA